MSTAAVIFTGQGAQSAGMGREVFDASAAARDLFRQAADIVGFDLAQVCFEGPTERLEQTDVQQPAIFVTSAAIWAAFLERGGTAARFCRAGGLSLGEYTALYAAGALDFADGLRLVRRRGQLMQQAAQAAPSGMISLIGADAAAAAAVCDRARGSGVLVAANFNCPGQVVISGSADALERVEAAAAEVQVRPVRLGVAGAFHSPLMAPAAEGLRTVLAESTIRPPTIPVARNVDAAWHRDAASIRLALERQLTEPVLWQRCVERMVADGARSFVEFGPGRVLTGLLRKIDRRLPVQAVNSPSDIDALLSHA
ncbi:MAG: [acyl-carrier-protein] S-malonyltransferase [Phycisphaerales bacterium]|nr:MAG: [acyl-carrier-protein] S-malonyltransferase [Phycisphaerales bacterium]